MSHPRFLDNFWPGLDTRIPQFCQLRRIALSLPDGIDDRHAGDPGQVCNHVLDLQVHLGPGFVHVLDMGASHLH